MLFVAEGLMIDRFHFHIPFKTECVSSVSACGEFGFVDLSAIYLPSLVCSITRDRDGISSQTLSHPWESLPSSYTPMAFKVFPGGPNYWPHVDIKASPAKLLQGHNVYGPDDPALCGVELLTLLACSMPELFSMLDLRLTQIMNIDCTYSVPLGNEQLALSVMQFLSNVENRHMKVSQALNSSCYWGKGSEHGHLKAYLKLLEMKYQISQLKKQNRHGCFDLVINTLSDEMLQDYAKDLLRLEAVLTKRKLKDLGVPTLFFDFCKYSKSLEAQNRNLIQELFMTKAAPLFEALEGAQMNVYSDDEVRERLKAKHGKYSEKTGKISYDAAMAAFRTYRAIAADGYHVTQEAMSRPTFYRHVKMICESGISKAQLENLHDKKAKVIPLVRLIELDFSKQYPDWYVEPVSQFDKVVEIPDYRLNKPALRLVS
jgi:II/X family phage/plasmid replication protein